MYVHLLYYNIINGICVSDIKCFYELKNEQNILIVKNEILPTDTDDTQ